MRVAGRRSRMRVRTLLLASVLASLIVTTGPGAARAVFPGTPGKLAFNDSGNIFTILPSGAGALRQLTFDDRSLNPRWSPDGKRIAFNRHGNIFVMWANGTNVHQVTTFGRSYQPAWSPGGRRLVFVHQATKGASGDLWVVRATGGTPTRLTQDGAHHCDGNSHPVWSPLGGRIAYEQGVLRSPDGSCLAAWPHVVVLKLATETKRMIVNAEDPDFTADGRGIFFSSAWDPESSSFWPWLNLSWSGIGGAGRTMLTFLLCAEGDNCFHEGVGAPDSAYPSNTSFVYTYSILDGPACVRTSDGAGFCDDTIPVFPSRMDWQPVP
jgi:dipeptidyl aminopeptidase/acylaminoacyl peptidase